MFLRKTYMLYMLLVGIVFNFFSCQKDNYINPEVTPKKYSYNITNKAQFLFTQNSENSETIIPYNNKLSIKNIGNSNLEANYIILTFENTTKAYHNITFIHTDAFNLDTEQNSDEIILENTNHSFSDENTIISLLNTNTSNHEFAGFYNGEINVLTSDEEPIFIQSFNCTGFFDFEGVFHFFTNNENEDNIVYLNGNINSNNLITGEVLNGNNELFSELSNITDSPWNMNNNNLTGSVMFSQNNETRILEFNLTLQN